MGAHAERFRRAADRGRRVAAALEQRPVAVSVVVRTYSGAVGLATSSLSSTTTTLLDPAPKVVAAGEGASSAFGGDAPAATIARLRAGEYAVGPITKTFAGGGYSAADLAPAGASTKRVTLILAGGGFAANGEHFEVVEVDDTSHPQSIYLRVARTRQ